MLPAGMSTAEKNSLCLYVPVFQYVMKMNRVSAYRCSVHAAAHLGKVEEDGEVGQGRSVERVSRGG